MPQGEPSHAEMIAWCRDDLSWKEHHGWPDDELEKHRAVLAHLERTQPTDTQADLTTRAFWHDGCGETPLRKRIGEFMMDGDLPEWAAEQLDQLAQEQEAALQSEREAAAAEARRAALEEALQCCEGKATARGVYVAIRKAIDPTFDGLASPPASR